MVDDRIRLERAYVRLCPNLRLDAYMPHRALALAILQACGYYPESYVTWNKQTLRQRADAFLVGMALEAARGNEADEAYEAEIERAAEKLIGTVEEEPTLDAREQMI